MSNHVSLPYHLYVNVKNSFLGPNMPKGTTSAIWHAIHSREGQVLMCHVILETGAHWSGLPIHAISTSENFDFSHQKLMPWGCMGDELTTTRLSYLEGLKVDYFKENILGRHTGIVIDWKDGFSRYPQEHKPLSLVELDQGQFALIPNNFYLLDDKHFVNSSKKDETKHYLRNEKVYWEE